MIRNILFALTAFGLAANATPALSQDPPPLTVLKAETKRYDTLIDMRSKPGVLCCAPFRLTNPDGDFVHLSIQFDVGWTDEMKDVRLRGIGLLLPGEKKPRPIFGYFERAEIFRTGMNTIFQRKPRKWPNVDQDVWFNAVFMVPRGTTTGTLVAQRSDWRLDVDLAAPTTEPLKPSSLIKTTIEEMSIVDGITSDYKSSRQLTLGKIKPSTGKIVEVKTRQQILASNGIKGIKEFFDRAQDYALVGPDGAPLRFLGTITNQGNTFQQRWSRSSRWQSALPEVNTYTLYFLGNGAPGPYTLYWMTDPIATGTLVQ
ncbi:MAG: hypothetical protein AAFO73_01445 [Pseudomonadota bacterium]